MSIYITNKSGSSGNLTAPTKSLFTSTGAQAGILFTISTSTTCAVGDTYTSANSEVFTVLIALSTQSGQVLYMSGTGAAPTSPLTRTTGSGTSSISFSATTILASYSTPTGAQFLQITGIGGGGGGGGAPTAAANSAAGAGGGGGGGFIKWISSPAAIYYYCVGLGGSGASAGANPGAAGTITAFVGSGAGPYFGAGGSGGAAGTNGAGTGQNSAQSSGGTGSGDIPVPGGIGGAGYIYTTGDSIGGYGGPSALAFGPGAIGTNGTNGTAGVGFGDGGSGGAQLNNSGTKSGGNGSSGLLLIQVWNQ